MRHAHLGRKGGRTSSHLPTTDREIQIIATCIFKQKDQVAQPAPDVHLLSALAPPTCSCNLPFFESLFCFSPPLSFLFFAIFPASFPSPSWCLAIIFVCLFPMCPALSEDPPRDFICSQQVVCLVGCPHYGSSSSSGSSSGMPSKQGCSRSHGCFRLARQGLGGWPESRRGRCAPSLMRSSGFRCLTGCDFRFRGV